MRCFVALEVTDATRRLAQRIRTAVTQADEAWQAEKWVALENLHVTLAFLGNVDDEQLTHLTRELQTISASPFVLGSPTVEAVPRPSRASMLWMRYIDGADDCAALAAAVRRCADRAGIASGDRERRFSPHVTLVRARHGRGIARDVLDGVRRVLDSVPESSVSVLSVTVFASSLGSAGPKYRKLCTVPLLGDPRP